MRRRHGKDVRIEMCLVPIVTSDPSGDCFSTGCQSDCGHELLYFGLPPGWKY